jgi:photosystem II stability/assembly factor-like uncharacterized protein
MLSRSSLVAASLAAALLPAVLLPAAALASGGRSSPSANGAQNVQSLQQVWTIGASTAWAWTVDGSAATGPQGLDLTTNGGKTWTRVTPPGLGSQGGDHYITGLFALDASHAWVTYGGLGNGAAQTIESTSDGGRHWTAVGHEPLSQVGFSGFYYDCGLDFVTASIGWCETTPAFVGSEASFIYRTANGGRTWQLVSVTPGPPPDPAGSLPWNGDKDTQFVTPATGWTVFSEAGAVTAPLYESVNAGKTWIKRSVAKAPGSFDGGSGFTGQPVIAGKAGAVGYTIAGLPLKSVVYVTTDGGTAWHAVTPPGKPAGWLVDVITPDSWRLVAGDHILATGNAGRTWRTITSNVSFSLFYAFDDPTAPVVNFATPSTGWIVAASLWRTTNGGTTWHKLTVPGT